MTGGTKVLSDRIVIRVSVEPGSGFLDRMISLVEGASRQKTPNEIALGILLVAMTAIFLAVVITLLSLRGIQNSSRANQSRRRFPTRPRLPSSLPYSYNDWRPPKRHWNQRHRPPHTP